MTPEEEIKQFALQRGAEQVGIASVENINKYAPLGHRPDDILPEAKGVIVIAAHQTLQSAFRSPDYRTLYANREFLRIRGGITIAIAKFIQSRYGYYSIGQTPSPVGFNASLSYKLCGEMAGLGTRSMAAGILLNRKLGLPEFWVSITTMPLTADAPMKEPVCPHPSCVKLWERRRTTPCLGTCPECLSGELEGGRIKWMRYDRRICSTRAQTESTSTLQRILLEASNEPDPEVRRNLLLGSLSRRIIETIAAGMVTAQCSECFRHCPICVEARRLKPKKTKARQTAKQPLARRSNV